MVFKTILCILGAGLIIIKIIEVLLEHNEDGIISKFHLGKSGLNIEFLNKEKSNPSSED